MEIICTLEVKKGCQEQKVPVQIKCAVWAEPDIYLGFTGFRSANRKKLEIQPIQRGEI